MKRHHLSLIILGIGLCLAFLAGGCASTPAPESIDRIPPMSFNRLWRANLALSGDDAMELHVRDEQLFIYTENRMAYVIDRASGQIKYSTRVADRETTVRPPVVLPDRVIYPTPSSLLIYDKQGNKLQTKPLPFPLRSGAVGMGTRVFFGVDAGSTGRVICMDLAKATGSEVAFWEFLTPKGVTSTPVYFQGLLYSACDDGSVVAVLADGQSGVPPSAWPITETHGVFYTYGKVSADLRADEQGVYVASQDTKLYCLDRTKGVVRWQYHATVPLIVAPWVTSSMVYQMVDGVGLVAIDKFDPEKKFGPVRKPKWIVPNAAQYLAEDEKSGYTFLALKDHSIVAVDMKTGETKFTAKRKDFVAYGANTTRSQARAGIIYAATREGWVYAITPVYKAGVTGELVLDARPLCPVALAR